MADVIIRLAAGLGLQNVIGFFPPVVTGVVNVLPLLLALFYYADKSREYNKTVEESKLGITEHDAEYDFIIVGAGSAGSVVANRLSQHFNVLLLERGGEPNPLTTVPGLQAAMVGRPETDYQYLTVPQNATCLGMKNRQCLWNAGSGMGGSSNINGLIFLRGHPLDFDRWSRHVNDDRWAYKNLLPFFLQHEGYCEDCDPSEGVKPVINLPYHNSKGELPIRPSAISPLTTEFLKAQDWGEVHRGDLNAPFYRPTTDALSFTLNRGRRVSTYYAFIAPLLGERETLTIKKYARVIEVLFEEGTNKAIGVKYERFGKIETAKCSKEVVLSAGAIVTPKILMMSGIGPADDLHELNIPVRSNIPVGRNLQNHVGAVIGPFLIDQPLSIIPSRDWNEAAVNNFLKNGTGPIAAGGIRAGSFWLSHHAMTSGETNWPDIQISLTSYGVSLSPAEDYERIYNTQPKLIREFLDSVRGNDSFSLSVIFTRPLSRGTIKLKSSNYMDDPIIDPQLLEDPHGVDIQVIVEALQRANFLVHHAPSFKKIGAKLHQVPFPSCRHYEFQSEEYWSCYVRFFPATLHHYIGTASMGSVGSSETVVDPEMKVVGIEGLRVIDASVMPYLVTGNTHAATIMCGERGAEFIISKYLKGI